MYAWYRQVYRPTAVEHSVFCNFTSENEKDLIVSSASQLTIYRIQQSKKDSTAGTSEDNDDVVEMQSKLEEIGTWSLFGNIVSLNYVRLGNSRRDSLLLSFLDAKLSIIEFDPTAYEIKTLSLHYFEDSIHRQGLLQHLTLPVVAVDPDCRCAVMKLTNVSIAIIAFRSQDASIVDQSAVQASASSSKRSISSYEIDLREVDSRLQRIVDMEFLHGYYEPTLLILFESLRTWSGRVSARQDTCNIVAISLNTTEKLHPVVWSLNGLPYDCKKAYAVPKPIGGILVFAVNSLLYLNQSVPPYGVALNDHTANSTSFPLKTQEGVCMELGGSHASFLSPETLVISLRDGDLYVLTLVVDSMRSVRNFIFAKSTSSVLSSCVTTMENGFLFIGSRLGNSVLLCYTSSSSEPANPAENEGPSAKRKRVGTSSEWTPTSTSSSSAAAAAVSDEMDENDMYGRDNFTFNPLSSYNFQVCDNLINIGPCGSAELGEPAYLSEEFVNQRETDLELVLLSGYGKNGSLSVLQRTVKPQIVTTFELPGCIDMWTVCSSKFKKVQQTTTVDPTFHGYLLLSREDSTLVLETGKEIMEVEESGFTVREPSVFVGNIGSDNLVLQVCSASVSLLDGIKLLQHIPLELGAPIAQCSLCDPYASLLTSDGQIILLTLKADEAEAGVRLHCSNPSIAQLPVINTVCLYCDRSGMFVRNRQKVELSNKTYDDDDEDEEVAKPDADPAPVKSYTADEEDELLYGETDFLFDKKVEKVEEPVVIPEEEEEPASKSPGSPTASAPSSSSEKTYWILLIRDDSHLEIYEMPNYKLVYAVKNLTTARKLLIDSSNSYSLADLEKSEGRNSNYSTNCKVLEVQLFGLGQNGSKPYLMVRLEDEMLVYKAFSYEDSQLVSNGLKLRFRKVEHGMVVRRSHDPDTADTSVTSQAASRSQLRRFDNICGYSGVFLCGAYPYWMVSSSRGPLFCHPMNVDGHVTTFVPFHNTNCPRGFLYFNKQGELRICMLPSHMRYDNDWPVRKMELGATPHFISYSIEHKVYPIVTSVSEACKRIPYMTCENEKEFEELSRDEKFIPPRIDKFSLSLVSPLQWEPVPNARIDMEDEFEHVTCMKNVWLNPSPVASIRQNYVVMGTSNVMGEEMSSRGRIIIAQVIEVVPEPGQPLTKNRFKKIYSEAQKGPVTALCGVEGNLLTAIGQKIFIWRFDDNQSLRGLAFVDSNVYIHHALSFRSFALIGDIQRSVTLLRYQEEFKTLSVMSRDVRPTEIYTIDLLVEGRSVGFLSSDHDKNLLLLVYDPEARESNGGSRLIRRADIHIGSNVNCMWRIGAVQTDRATGRNNEAYLSAHVTMMGTLDGALGHVLPLTEKIYRRLSMLQSIMSTSSQHTAGLNPKSFRQVRSSARTLGNPMKNVIDGDLLWKYLELSKMERFELAKKIGTTPEQIADDLTDIHRSTCVM